MMDRIKGIYALLLLVEATCLVMALNVVYVPLVPWYPIVLIPLLAFVLAVSNQLLSWMLIKIEPEAMFFAAKTQEILSQVNLDRDRVLISTGYAFGVKGSDGKPSWLDIQKDEPTLDLLKSRLVNMRKNAKNQGVDLANILEVVPCETFCIGKVFEESAQKAFIRSVDAKEKQEEEVAKKHADMIKKIQQRDRNPVPEHPLNAIAARVAPYKGFIRFDGVQPSFCQVFPTEESAEASGPGKTISVLVSFGWDGTKDFPDSVGMSMFNPKSGSVGSGEK